MNTDIELKRGAWVAVVGPRSILPALLRLTASLAESGPVRVVDGGNVYNVYPVARAVRGRPELLERIKLSRAFSCYQMLAMLESLFPPPGWTGTFIILDLLRSFYDESVNAWERKRLLQLCLAHLDRLVLTNGALVSVHPPGIPSPVAIELLEMLTCATKDTRYVETPVPAPAALRLF